MFYCSSRNEIRANNLFSVADCKMHWQKSGDYLCVKVDRFIKSKKEKEGEVKYSVSIKLSKKFRDHLFMFDLDSKNISSKLYPKPPSSIALGW